MDEAGTAWWVGLDNGAKGRIAQAKVLARAAVKGWIASVAQEGARYDLVLDDGERLYRAQVKWAGDRRMPGVAIASLQSWTGNDRDRPRGKQRRYAAGRDRLRAGVRPDDRLGVLVRW